MRIAVGMGVGMQQRAGTPATITGTAPVLAALDDGDTLSTAVTWGSYTSSAGTIVDPTVKEMSVNGAAYVAYNGATVVAADDTYCLRETVTDSAANERVFVSAVVTVEAVVGPGTENAYDLLVTNQTEFANIMNGTTPVTSGDVIAFDAGLALDLDAFSFTSSQPVNVTWTSRFPANRGSVTKWDLRNAGAGAITFKQLNIAFNLPTERTQFWGPAGVTTHAVINADQTALTALTIDDCDIDGGMARFLDGGRMTHANAGLYIRNSPATVIVRNSVFHDIFGGMQLDSIDGFTVENNEFYNFHADPINLQNSEGPCQNGVIRNNHYHSPGGHTGNFHSDCNQFQPTAISGNPFANIEIYGNTASFGDITPIAQVDPTATLTNDTLVKLDATAGNITYPLPDATTRYIIERVDATGNTVTITSPGAYTISGGDYSLASGNAILFAPDAMVYTPSDTGGSVDGWFDATQHGQEIRFKPLGGATYPLPSAIGNKGKQFLCRYIAGGTGTVTFTLNGSDTADDALTLSAAGEFTTFVSDGAGNWGLFPQGYRSWFIPRDYSFTAGDLEDGFTTMLDASGGNITVTLPATGTRTFHFSRADGSANTVTVAGDGDTITLNGSSVSSFTMAPGYGVDLTRTGDGNWTATEKEPTFIFLFSNGNAGNWSNIKIHSNVGNIPESAIRVEDDVTGFLVYNNTFAPFITTDRNGDGVIGRFEGNDGLFQLYQLSGTGQVFNNVGGNLLNGTNGPTISLLGNDFLGISDTDPIPAAITDRFNGTTRADYVTTTRAETIAAFLAKAGGPYDGTFIGALGTTAANGHYNFTAGEVNTAALPAPTLGDVSPNAGGTAGLDAVIEITFDQFISLGTGNIVLRNITDGVDVETFNAATGLGDNTGTLSVSDQTLTITPGANTVDGKDYAISVIQPTAIVGHYGKTFAGIADETTIFWSAVDIPTDFSVVTVDVDSLARAGGFSTLTGNTTKILLAYNLQRTGGDSLSRVIDFDFGNDVRIQVLATGQTRAEFGLNSFRLNSSVPVAARETVIIAVDMTAATAVDGVQFYKNGTAVDMATATSVVWSSANTAGPLEDGTVSMLNNIAASGNQFAGDVGFIYAAFPATLPDLSDPTERAKFGPGQIIPTNGTSPTGAAPAVFVSGTAAAAWNIGANQGTEGDFTVVGTFVDA